MPSRARSKNSWVRRFSCTIFMVFSCGAIFGYTDNRRQEMAPTVAVSEFGGTGSHSAIATDIPQARVADEPAYVSAGEVPLKHLHSAIVLSPDRFAVADGVTGVLYFISTTEGLLSESVPTSLPPMVPPVLFTGRVLDGKLAVWRPDRNDAFVLFSAQGDQDDLIRYPHGHVVGAPVPVAVFPNGNVVVQRRGRQMPTGLIVNRGNTAQDPPPGVVRFEAGSGTITEIGTVDYESVSVSVGTSTTFQNRRVIFGDQMLVAGSGTHFLVGRTDFEQVFAYDQTGHRVYTVPIPGARSAVSEADIIAQRYQRIAEGRRRTSPQNMSMEAEFAKMMGRDYTPVNKDSLAVLQLAGKNSAPPVDRMLADLSGRVWFRLTAMPTDTVTSWCVWSPASRGFEFWMALPRHERLLDAFPDAILLVNDRSADPDLIVREFTIPGTLSGIPSTTCLKGQDS